MTSTFSPAGQPSNMVRYSKNNLEVTRGMKCEGKAVVLKHQAATPMPKESTNYHSEINSVVLHFRIELGTRYYIQLHFFPAGI